MALKTASIAAAAVALALATGSGGGGVDAVCLRSHGNSSSDPNCTDGPLSTLCTTNGACFPIDRDDFTGSGRVDCATNEDGSTWQYIVYGGRGCMSADQTFEASGTGLACNTAPDSSTFVVDCSAQPSCFSAASTATLASGERVRVRDLAVGDRVVVADADGRLTTDKVFRIPHHNDDEIVQFVRISTESGRVLEVSPGHMLHHNQCCSLDDMSLASDVRAGDLVYVHAGAGEPALTPDRVASVELVERAGAYNPHTLTGQIVVDGVAASHFTSETTWKRRSLATLWYRALDLVSPLFGGAEDASKQQ